MLCGIENIPQNILSTFRLNMGEYVRILSVPHNIVMNLNNVMPPPLVAAQFIEVVVLISTYTIVIPSMMLTHGHWLFRVYTNDN